MRASLTTTQTTPTLERHQNGTIMVTFTVKGIPPVIYGRLKARAAENRRSINSEILVCLEEILVGQRRDPKEIIAEADRLRAKIKMKPFTDKELRAAKEWGRA